MNLKALAVVWMSVPLVWVGADAQAIEVRSEGCPKFAAEKIAGYVEEPSLTEASGLVASRKNPGVLWTHNDSGNAAWIYALSTTGITRALYAPASATNRDWEDIAIGPGPKDGQDYLYIGEIGDNKRKYPSVTVYRIPEPQVPLASGGDPLPLKQAVALRLQYPEGERHNAETLLIDPESADLYILTKNLSTGVSGLYRAAFPQNETGVSQLEHVGTLTFEGGRSQRPATGGDISADGKTILIRTYTQGYLWQRPAGASLASTLESSPCTVPLALEPQGESVALSADGEKYFTLSEGSHAPIYVYERLPAAPGS